MSEDLDERQALIDLVRDFATREAAPRAAEDERQERFPSDLLEHLAKLDLLGLPIPVEHGGSGQSSRNFLAVLEELARAHLVLALSVSVHALAAFPVAAFGTPEQQQRVLPKLASGEWLGAYCLSEPGSGSDAAALRTRVERRGDGWAITGSKAWVTHSGLADLYNVLARTSGEGAGGISAFLVRGDAEGLSFGKPEDKMGLRASPTAIVNFDAVDAEPVGEEGQGFRIALAALDSGRLGIAACAVGLAQASFEAASEFATSREQFGRPIIEFEGVGFKLADMATTIAAARALLHRVAESKDAGVMRAPDAAMAKLFATDTAMRVATEAVQVHGGYGYTKEYAVERYFREAKVLQIVEGTNEIQRLVIARAIQRGL